jgi:hypothetical protein
MAVACDTGDIMPPKRPRDANQRAKLIVDLSVGEAVEADSNEGKDPAAIARGRSGELKGGVGRDKALSHERKVAIGRKAAAARWGRK